MQNKKISIIIPVYKVEKYLDKCINSIINQTYRNLEIILVDDGSPDNCPKMCDEWSKKDNRIKVVHKTNEGVSVARNTGIDIATGDYIGFVDSDDYIEFDMYEKLLKSSLENDSDITMCGFKHVYEDGSVKEYVETNLKNINSKNIYDYFFNTSVVNKNNVFYSNAIMCSVWRNLIKKDYIKDLRFMNFSIAEDLVFMMNLINEKTKISVVNESLYCYLQRENSAIHSFSENKIQQRYKTFKYILSLLEKRMDEKFIKSFKFYNYASLVNEMLKNNKKELLKEYLRDDFFASLNTKEGYKIEKQNAIGIKRKFGYFLVHKKFFNLYSLLVKLR